jgi:hypothetical protein
LVAFAALAPRKNQVPAAGNVCDWLTTPVVGTETALSETHFVGVLLLAICRFALATAGFAAVPDTGTVELIRKA